MGSRVRHFKHILILTLALMLSTTQAQAGTVKDLYSLYHIRWQSDYPKGVLDTIRKYQSAAKYTYMYSYVDNSTYDRSIINNRVTEYKAEVKSLKKRLLAGIDLDISTLYELEDEYKTAKINLDNAKKSTKTSTINIPKIHVSNALKQRYKEAVKRKKLYEKSLEIGSTKHLPYPVDADVIPVESTAEYLQLEPADGSCVLALFDGVVVKATSNSVTVSHGHGVETRYTNLGVVTVLKGQNLSQWSPLGMTKGKVKIQLMINNKLVDIRKLFEEEVN